MKKQVLVFFVKSGKVLLAKKNRKAKVASLKMNGYGGDIEEGETPDQAAVREVAEETGNGINIREQNLISRGRIDFFLADNKTKFPNFQVNFFVCYDFTGEANETEEMGNPAWYDFGCLNGLDMMPADREFLPQILCGRSVSGWVRFNSGLTGVESNYLQFY